MTREEALEFCYRIVGLMASPHPKYTSEAVDAVLRLGNYEREECAKVADTWANSVSCVPGEVCDHIRTGAEIARRIRERAQC